MQINVQGFMETLPLMGKGMLGIFAVTGIIICAMYLLNVLTKEKK